jgi:hypothetical protein
MKRAEIVAILNRPLTPYPAQVAKLAIDGTWKLAQRFAPADLLVYDNYNFVVSGFTLTGRPSEAFISLAVAWDHVSICFLQGALLCDPEKRLRGEGKIVRNVRLESLATIDDPYISNLIDTAMAQAKKGGSSGKAVLQSVSEKKRRPMRTS